MLSVYAVEMDEDTANDWLLIMIDLLIIFVLWYYDESDLSSLLPSHCVPRQLFPSFHIYVLCIYFLYLYIFETDFYRFIKITENSVTFVNHVF